MSAIAIDTNVLIRLLVGDDLEQQQKAIELFEMNHEIMISTTVLIETVWVLLRVYKTPRKMIVDQLRNFIVSVPNLVVKEDEIEAGLAVMENGGDFADGVNEYIGSQLGAEKFATFDKKAANILNELGRQVILLR
ncbi:type II toxin-antitoxin system VapC family toxin [Neisseria sp. 83E34]|uniref:type II toxin-antitoxin system VapC family toxin n=1 Tax=Neisseria sp. 83E34 TaxID=1692264 RepID=UPI0006CE7215|nr:type II toxin-antitoxin system VapC family toxin [Neisseria sp. 83E34]KPN72652.1 toxin-antitoxin system, toxin component, PIN family protein [Neisseria sp. 83E34]